MKFGCTGGWLNHPGANERFGMAVCADLSHACLNAAMQAFQDAEVTPKYLCVDVVPIAQKVLYAYAVARGLKELPLTLVRDSACKSSDGVGWLVTDEFPERGKIVSWDYVFPQNVRVVNGTVEADEAKEAFWAYVSHKNKCHGCGGEWGDCDEARALFGKVEEAMGVGS